jgi:predicted TPR repeat methyltransferase
MVQYLTDSLKIMTQSAQKNLISEFQQPLLDNLEGIDSNDIIARYAEFAPVYNQSVSQWGYEVPELVVQSLREYIPSTTASILDAGCGTGLVGDALVQSGYTQIVGIDISPEMLVLAKKTECYQQLKQHDLMEIPYPFTDNSFIAITCVGVFSLIKNPFPVLSEFCRLVQPGGYFIFTQRENLYAKYDYDTTLRQFETKGFVRCIKLSQPINYLPKRKGYDDHKLFILVYEVLK